MGILNTFGADGERIAALGHTAVGVITDVRECWWIGSSPAHAGAYDTFPHLVYFSYSVDNIRYSGCRYVAAGGRFPETGEEITVYYDPENPKNFAVRV